jgi:hypothetical protein
MQRNRPHEGSGSGSVERASRPSESSATLSEPQPGWVRELVAVLVELRRRRMIGRLFTRHFCSGRRHGGPYPPDLAA